MKPLSDVNGTFAVDGSLLPSMTNAIRKIPNRIKVYLITANTKANKERINSELGIEALFIQRGQEASQKSKFVSQLGAEKLIAVGQGANKSEMLKTAVIGTCVYSQEETSIETLLASDIIVNYGLSAFKLIQNPMRMVAILRK